ncbi:MULTISPECIES: hypothetical protein [Burkholderia]|uniref:hypothetical protein n=1 Tax=Burkholderia TaxID=32008 RepID=UPI000B79EB6C|nr:MULTISPECIES: hypothetical protein [Burkholderia]MBY4724619.1 hypothetical protein [Burkholderia contaminans]MCI3972930.1 hypothetical protein [Burkholderia sp. HI4860]MDN7788660.1 hypothetical protein [Burkholderia contaminans]OXJ01064.1 hypothetical protein CFB48_13465 [Burkholderia sp. AU33647]
MNKPYPIDVGATEDLVLISTDAPMADTLQQASDTLEQALSILLEEAMNSKTATLFGVVTLVQLAKGVVESTIGRALVIDKQGTGHA